MNEQIVHIVDDDHAVLDSLRELTESVGLKSKTYESASCFLEQSSEAESGCLVLDLRMPKISGLELQKKLKESGNTLPIVFMTAYGDVSVAVEAMKEGAVDFVQKPYHEQSLLDSINTALKKDRLNRSSNASNEDFRQKLSLLTARQAEVMELLASSMSNKEIARKLGISPRTVEVHRQHVMKKLGLKTVSDLVLMLK